MKKGLIYVHGKGGNAAEADHYKLLFPEYDVIGLDYKADTPWDAKEEFSSFYETFAREHDPIILVASSIGAFFSMYALYDKNIEKAFFISPIVDMEKLIHNMMRWAKVSEEILKSKGIIDTDFGETLSWEYLLWIRKHPLLWKIPTTILYGANDNLQTIDMVKLFASDTGATVTIMKNGEHWFHTDAQMVFLDHWIIGQ